MIKSDSSNRSETKGRRRCRSVGGESPTPSTRIDAPHEQAVLSSAPQPEAPAAVNDETTGEQVRLQALQLANYLRGRQKELDAREAQLNSRIAGFESDFRAARLWLDERRAELAGGCAETGARAALLDEREEELARRERTVFERERALNERHQELTRREKEFEERLERLAVAETARERNESAAAECLTNAQLRADELERLADERRRAMADLDRQRQAVARRAEHVDKSKASLLQLREELGRMHRETLEIRLATEELWVQLSGAAPPAALTRSLGQIRTRLAEQYAQANAELAEQKKELEVVRGRLEGQLDKLLDRKRQFDKWVADRQRECDGQASRLIAREERLAREEEHLREEAERWRAERLKFQRELKRFKAGRSARRSGNAAAAC